MAQHTAAGHRFRRKVAREFRQRINEIRRWRESQRRGWGSWVMCEAAGKAGIPTEELRAIVFGTRDPDVMTIGAIAHALDLKPSILVLEKE